MKKKILTAGFVYALTLTLIPVAMADDASRATGQLIDELTAKNSGLITAESALPSKKEVKKEMKSEAIQPATAAKNAESTEPVFNSSTMNNSVSKATESTSIWGRFLISFIILGGLACGAYYFLRKWPGAQKLKTRTKMIEVLSQQYLGPKKSLAVIRVAGEAVLVGVTDHNISLLKTLSLLDDELPAETQQARFNLKNEETQKFGKALKANVQNEQEDDFSMAGLKEIVGGKLRGMKEF